MAQPRLSLEVPSMALATEKSPYSVCENVAVGCCSATGTAECPLSAVVNQQHTARAVRFAPFIFYFDDVVPQRLVSAQSCSSPGCEIEMQKLSVKSWLD